MEYRLNKYISSSGICSRREADRFIEQGNVTVNGKRATVGMRVLPGQVVKVNGQLIENDIEPVYIAFNKPVGIVCTTDTGEKDNIVDYVGHEQRIFPVGRLDKDSQGLILLTNDGDIINKILRAGNNHKKDYLVTVDKTITEDFMTRMSQGVPILDRVTRKCQMKMINPHLFQITLIQGLNRQIRRMCEYFGYGVVKLERIQVMNIKLGNLKQGSWRNLTEAELETLFDMIEDSENTEKKKSASSAKVTTTDKPKSKERSGERVSRNSQPKQNAGRSGGRSTDRNASQNRGKSSTGSSGRSGGGRGRQSTSSGGKNTTQRSTSKKRNR